MLQLLQVHCCICKSATAKATGSGKDFEYHTSSQNFTFVQCNGCGLVYLNPRPSISEFEKIYPPDYHAFNFSEKIFGLVHKVRSRLEAKRVLSWCAGLPGDAVLLDVGCGDGFHLKLLRQYGNQSWSLEGIDMDTHAVKMAQSAGLKVHKGTIEKTNLPSNTYDLAFTIQTIEHVENPGELLKGIYRVLKPGGRVVIVTDNTGSIDFTLFKKRYWGGYHFPRHWNLFNKKALAKLAEINGFEVQEITTQCSPVNWVYTIHNFLVDKKAPLWLIKCFTLKSILSLVVFTITDIILQKFGKGALLRAVLVKPG